MKINLLMIMMILMSIMFILMNHPLSMGFTLLMQTVMISIMTGMLNLTYWFSYILFLVMIGGMLILFVYMTSIASNEKFKFSLKTLIFSINFTMLMFYISMLIDKNLLNMKTKEIFMFNNSINYFNMNLKYFSMENMILMISAMLYLLITLVMIVKITKKNSGPLRQKN